MNNPNIELTSSSKPTWIHKLTSNSQHHYDQLPQEDKDSTPQPQKETSQTSQRQSGIFSRMFSLDANKARKIFIMLIICIYIIEIPFSIRMINSTGSKYEIWDWKEGPILRSLSSMSANLKTNPIMEIQIINHGLTCPSGFQPLKLANWPGTVAGCLCKNGYLKGISCAESTSDSCKIEVPSTSPIEMYEWENSVWCAKRAVLGIDYLKRAECPVGYKECYPGGCFLNQCPITKVEIIATKETINKFNGKAKSLVLTRTPGELPLINIQVTLGDIPCWTQDLVSQNITNSSYKLSVVRENECEKYGLNSHFSTQIDSKIAFQSFSENSFPDSVLNLPHFEENFNSTISVLSSVVRMKTAKNDNCLEIDEKFTKDFFYTLPAYLSMICAIIFITSQVIIFISRLNLLCEHSRAEEVKQQMMYYLFGSLIISYIQIIFEILWYLYFWLPFQEMKEGIQRYDSLGCFVGSQGQIVISDYLERIKMNEDCFSFHLLVVMFNIPLTLVWVWYYNVRKRLSYQWYELLIYNP